MEINSCLQSKMATFFPLKNLLLSFTLAIYSHNVTFITNDPAIENAFETIVCDTHNYSENSYNRFIFVPFLLCLN